MASVPHETAPAVEGDGEQEGNASIPIEPQYADKESTVGGMEMHATKTAKRNKRTVAVVLMGVAKQQNLERVVRLVISRRTNVELR